MFCAVDEDFTAYGLLDHRHTPEIEQNLSYAADGTALANRAQVLVHSASGADEPRHPRHLLRPAGRRRPRHRAAARSLPRHLSRRAVRRGRRAVTVDQGDARLELDASHRPLRRAHRLDHGDRRARQPHQGRVGPSGAVRQHRRRPARGARARRGRVCTRERARATRRRPRSRRCRTSSAFKDKIVVIKYGGNAMVDDKLAQDVRAGHRADALGRHPPGRRARRRSADRRPTEAVRHQVRVPRRSAGHRCRHARSRPHGARGQGQQRDRVGHQHLRPARDRRVGRRGRAHPGQSAQPRARLRRRRHRGEPAHHREAAGRRPHPGHLHHR